MGRTKLRTVIFSGGSLDGRQAALRLPVNVGVFIWGGEVRQGGTSEIYNVIHNWPEDGVSLATFASEETRWVYGSQEVVTP